MAWLDEEAMIAIHHQYKQGHISREVAERFLGDGIDEIEREREAFSIADELDTTGVFHDQ